LLGRPWPTGGRRLSVPRGREHVPPRARPDLLKRLVDGTPARDRPPPSGWAAAAVNGSSMSSPATTKSRCSTRGWTYSLGIVGRTSRRPPGLVGGLG
jgi:hypothetical protein